MKIKLIILLFILVGTFSCRKDGPTVSNPTPNPTVVDYRDTILGNYIGAMRFIQFNSFSGDTIEDTTYIRTLNVTIDSASSNFIYVGNYHLILNSNYTFQDNPINNSYPHSAPGGLFTFSNDTTYIEFHTHTNYGSYLADELFYGTK